MLFLAQIPRLFVFIIVVFIIQIHLFVFTVQLVCLFDLLPPCGGLDGG